MTNLIPPNAKQQLKRTYWLRVISVWGMLWALALFCGVLLLLPNYFLIHYTNVGYSDTVQAAYERTEAYDDMVQEISRTSDQAKVVIANEQAPRLTRLIGDIKAQAGVGATVQGISVARDAGNIAPITITGQAESRQTLADFRDQIAALPYADSVELPIENLAASEDIIFTITLLVDQAAL